MQNCRPPCPPRPHGERVNDRLEALLARVDGLKRASTLKPTRFDARGQQHAREAAQRDQVPENDTWPEGGGALGPPGTTPGSVA